MSSGISSLIPPSSCYLLTAALGKLQDDRILRLLAENRGVVKLQIKHTQMGRRPHLTNQSSTTLWLSTLEWDGHAGRLNGEVTIKHLNIRRDMMELLIMGKHSKRRNILWNFESWLDDAASRSTEMSFPKPLNSGVATDFMRVMMLWRRPGGSGRGDEHSLPNRKWCQTGT